MLIYLRHTVSSKIVFLSRLRQEASWKPGFSFRMVLKTKEAQEPVGSIVTACCKWVSLAWWSRISVTRLSRALSPSPRTLWSTKTREKSGRLRGDGEVSRNKREDSLMPSSANAATCPRSLWTYSLFDPSGRWIVKSNELSISQPALFWVRSRWKGCWAMGWRAAK